MSADAVNMVIAALARLPGQLQNAFRFARPGARAVGFTVRSSAAPLIKSKALAFSLIGFLGTLYGYLQSILFVVLAVWLLPFLFSMLKSALAMVAGAFEGVVKFLEGFQRQPLPLRMLILAVKLIPVMVVSIYHHIVYFFFTHMAQLLGLVVIGVAMIYLLERHLNATLEVAAAFVSLGVNGYNFAGQFLEITFQFINLITPITNALQHASIMWLIHIWEGLKLYGGAEGTRRLLTDLDIPESVLTTYTNILRVFLVLYDVFYTVVYILIDLFFQLGLAYAFQLISGYIIVVLTKLGCALTGRYCFVQEVFYVIVNVALVPIAKFFCFGLCDDLAPVEIGCTAQVLASFGVSPQCAGEILSFDPPGFYHNAGGRRRMISCVQTGLEYHESLDEASWHVTTNATEACPLSRAAFDQYGHALNMFHLDTHIPYHVCMNGVLVEAWDRTAKSHTLLGGCGDSATKNITRALAERRLGALLGAKPKLTTTAPKPGGRGGAPMTRSALATWMREKTGSLHFTSRSVVCDLSSTTGGTPFEILTDAMCLVSRLVHDDNLADVFSFGASAGGGGGHGRRVSSESAFERYLGGMRHTHGIWASQVQSGRPTDFMHPAHQVHRENPAVTLTELLRGRGQPESRRRRRSLEDVVDCQGLLLCPGNLHQCVSSYLDCTQIQDLAVVDWLQYQLNSFFSDILGSADPYEIMRGGIDCWYGYYADPSTDPVVGLNNLATPEQLAATTVFCFPMHPQSSWTHTKVTYSLRNELLAACAGVAHSFTNCHCPMYYDLPSTSLPTVQAIAEDMGFIVANGLITIKNVVITLVGPIMPPLWSNTMLFSPSISRVFSLYDDTLPGTVYVVCGVVRTGSLAVTLLVFIVFVRVALVLVDLVLEVIAVGMPSQGRVAGIPQRWYDMVDEWEAMHSRGSRWRSLGNKQ